MIEQKQQNIMKLAVMVAVLLGAIAIMLAFNPKRNPHVTAAEDNTPAVNTQEQALEPKAGQKLQLQDIVRLRRSWGPIMTSWYGEDAPDFKVKDVNGTEHKLSNYRGRNVLLIFWATWCGPCISEIPFLITLRGMTNENELMILAISNESPNKVKNFAAARKINYTVISTDTYYMPRPYSQINGIPTSFFITPQGKIKIVAEGAVSFNDMRALLAAE